MESQAIHGFEAALFDMDGVITRTSALHAQAWQSAFDRMLADCRRIDGSPVPGFDPVDDYLKWVDGRPREEGVRSYLQAVGICLPDGRRAADEPDFVARIAEHKKTVFARLVAKRGVELYSSTIVLLRGLRQLGVRTGVVTASRHGRELLRTAGISALFDARVDGLDASRGRLAGKPSPETFLRCAELLEVRPSRSVVFEDAAAGVRAARDGGFGLVVGVDRGGNAQALARAGADLVVADLDEVDIERLSAALAQRRAGVMAWRIEQEGFDPAREHAMESLFTMANGYLGLRGALDTPMPGSGDDLFVAGIYDRKHPDRPYSELEFMDVGREDPYAELVSLPSPLVMALAADGVPLSVFGDHCQVHRRLLGLQEGVLEATLVFAFPEEGHLRLTTRRAASLDECHLLVQELCVEVQKSATTLELDARGIDPELASRHPHLVPLELSQPAPTIGLQRFQTRVSGFEIVLVSQLFDEHGPQSLRVRRPCRSGDTLRLWRCVSVFTSRDGPAPREQALAHAEALSHADPSALLRAHSARWHAWWKHTDVGIQGSPATEQALRFNAYHLRATADHDPRVSIGARALSGRAYEGHVFWDVEVFMLPFYLHTAPEIARALLGYRYHTLAGARRNARELGAAGACYAWESTVTGDDVTPRKLLLKTTGREIPIFTGTQQLHVTAGVALGVWRYWEATHDTAFMRTQGCEILFETARFWLSRCVLDGARRHLRGVVGPDEYHHDVDDNAYTNWLARFNLERAAWAADWLADESPDALAALSERLDLDSHASAAWAQAAAELFCPQPGRDGVIEQFAGFRALPRHEMQQGERYRAPIDRLFDWQRINRLQLLKQADVLMLLHLFPDRFSDEVVAANYHFYEPRTDHGSSLSPPIHAAIAARIGEHEAAWRYWQQALWFDLDNLMGNGALGVHPACMGAVWQALVFGFLGVRFESEGPRMHEDARHRLPPHWRGVRLPLLWRGQRHLLELSR
ncbi:MAG: HAD family hydrolase [Gammaproteobacteria bacterium]|nr:MAG: HAD family hydrolase [Gammaproteobacteria bacterium]